MKKNADEIYDDEMRRFNKLVRAVIPILKEHGYVFVGWSTQFHDMDMIFRGQIQLERDCTDTEKD